MHACAAAGAYWPTMTLARRGSTAWVACKEQARLVRIEPPGGPQDGDRRVSPGAVIAVASGSAPSGRSTPLDALPHRSPRRTRHQADPARRGRRVQHLDRRRRGLGRRRSGRPRSCGSRPRRTRSIARIPVGDGPADMVVRREERWVIDHRDTPSSASTARRTARLASPRSPAAMPRPSAWRCSTAASGSPGAACRCSRSTRTTGRPAARSTSTAPESTSSRQPGALWVPVRTAAVDRTGFPTMTAVRRVTTRGEVTTAATARGRVDVHGLAAGARRGLAR